MIAEKTLLDARTSMTQKFLQGGYDPSYNKEHGQRWEEVLTEIYNIVTDEGNPWLQDGHTDPIDFTREMLKNSTLPKWVKRMKGGMEAKCIKKGTENTIKLGDGLRKSKKLQQGYALAIAVYDELPQNIVDIRFYKMEVREEDRNVMKLAPMVDHIVKEATWIIGDMTIPNTSRWWVSKINKKLLSAKNSRLYFTECSKTETDARQVQMVFRSKYTEPKLSFVQQKKRAVNSWAKIEIPKSFFNKKIDFNRDEYVN